MKAKIVKSACMVIFSLAVLQCSKDDINGDQLHGSWFLIQSCNSTKDDCSDIDRGNYILNFNSDSRTVIIEKNSKQFS